MTKSTEAIRFPPRTLIALNDAAADCFLVLLLLFLAGMVAVRFLPPDRRRELWLPGGVLLLLDRHPLSETVLTVAVVHSFDIERYSYNLLLYVVLCEAAAAVWLYELAWAFRVTEPAPESSPAPAAIDPFSSRNDTLALNTRPTIALAVLLLAGTVGLVRAQDAAPAAPVATRRAARPRPLPRRPLPPPLRSRSNSEPNVHAPMLPAAATPQSFESR